MNLNRIFGFFHLKKKKVNELNYVFGLSGNISFPTSRLVDLFDVL